MAWMRYVLRATLHIIHGTRARARVMHVWLPYSSVVLCEAVFGTYGVFWGYCRNAEQERPQYNCGTQDAVAFRRSWRCSRAAYQNRRYVSTTTVNTHLKQNKTNQQNSLYENTREMVLWLTYRLAADTDNTQRKRPLPKSRTQFGKRNTHLIYNHKYA